MDKNLDIQQKSKVFARRIIMLSKHLLSKNQKDIVIYIMVKQLIRCGTSVGANVRESKSAQSTPDFNSKLQIALKEGDEAHYWLELLHETEYLSDKEYESIITDCEHVNGTIVNILKKNKK